MYGDFLGYLKTITFQVKVTGNFLGNYWNIWATFYFNIWSHC